MKKVFIPKAIKSFIKMRFLTKDVNKSLLVMLIFFLVLFISFTVYYESSYRKLLGIKNQNDKRISEITAQLIIEKLNKTDTPKELALIDKAILENKYSALLIQKENLEKEKKELKQEITLLKSRLEYEDVRSDGPVAQFRLIQSKNQQINELSEKIAVLCSKIKEYDFYYKECDG